MTYLINAEKIAIQKEVSDWKQAIEEVGSLLVDEKSITTAYIQQMISSVENFGPYIVIAKGFALAHAAPSEAVLKTDISLITLKDAISFGSVNDPVYVVMCLACTDKISHIEKMKDIASILLEDGAIDKIYNAKTKIEIQNIFKKEEVL